MNFSEQELESLKKKFRANVSDEFKIKPYLQNEWKQILFAKTMSTEIVDKLSDEALENIYWQDYLANMHEFDDMHRIKSHPDISRYDYDTVQEIERSRFKQWFMTEILVMGSLFYYYRKKHLYNYLTPKKMFGFWFAAPLGIFGVTFSASNWIRRIRINKSGLREKYHLDKDLT